MNPDLEVEAQAQSAGDTLVAADRGHEPADRIVDVLTVILLSITAVLSALCVYQSARWSGDEAKQFNLVNAYRTASAEKLGRANTLEMVDVALVLRYLEALRGGDAAAQKFYFGLFRPESRAAIVAWLKLNPLHNPKAPAYPFEMKQYRLATDLEAARADRLAVAAFERATAATRNSDQFLLLTVIFATVAFFGGMSTKFRFPFHLIVVALGYVALVYGVIRMVDLPVFRA